MTDERIVPIRTMLRASTYRALAAAAEQRGTDVGGLLSLMADRSVTPKPAKPTKREHTAGTRRYLRATPELLERIRLMSQVERMRDSQIADALALTHSQVAYLRRERLGLPGVV